MDFKHTSVLLHESVEGLNLPEGGIYVDGTLGGGGHSLCVLQTYPTCSLVGIDQDLCAISAAKERLKDYKDRVTIVHNNFKNIKSILNHLQIEKIDGAILDLGVSSYQLDEADRGFSYRFDAPLDMRMDQENKLSAYEVVNQYSKEELMRVLYEYGEEKCARKIAERIVHDRKKAPIKTTGELTDIVTSIVHTSPKMGHPAKRTFQAIRIEVNGELELLEQAVLDFADVLKSGGRLCVITFHSLEDRIVKNAYKKLETACTCPKDFPVCVCGGKAKAKIITRKPILPSEDEIVHNKRAKSAKLRIMEKL